MPLYIVPDVWVEQIAPLIPALVVALASLADPLTAGVRLGDAVPGVIKGSDLERIRRQLGLEHFSVVAAVRLGAEEGREAILVEPLAERPLAMVKEACSHGAFCPDRFGFVGSRIRIVLLQNNDVLPLLSIDQEIRGSRGSLLSLRGVEAGGPLAGWSGWAEAAFGHVALVLTPFVEGPKGRVQSGAEQPIRIEWNEAAGRFQSYVCDEDDDGGASCVFEDEIAP